MFDHVSLKVKDAARSRAFYEKALAPLGYKVISEYEGGLGLGAEDRSALWIGQGQPHAPGVHLAFAASDPAAVQAFHKAALAAGGKDNGAPGPRPDYGPHYYAAFAHDPDGNNVEAVCNR
ncbi:MAG TPA: VOC family protein, partial [Candidatus Polarisedimenticolia bacterium]|nr:VOC family protein [Candidatus Polarisedimenticolia bacterium]